MYKLRESHKAGRIIQFLPTILVNQNMFFGTYCFEINAPTRVNKCTNIIIAILQ